MTLAKKFLGQPGPVYFMIHGGFGIIADSAAALDQPVGKLDILGDARPAWTKLLVKEANLCKYFTADGHIAAG